MPPATMSCLLGCAAKFGNYVKRYAEQQAFGINMGIQKAAAPGLKSANHLRQRRFR